MPRVVMDTLGCDAVTVKNMSHPTNAVHAAKQNQYSAAQSACARCVPPTSVASVMRRLDVLEMQTQKCGKGVAQVTNLVNGRVFS